MEYLKLDKEILKDKNLKSNEKLVLIYLIGYNNSDLEYSFPTYKQIKDDTGISIKTLAKIFNSLEDKGYIRRANNPNKGGRNNVYYIYKYVVTDKVNDMTSQEPTEEVVDNQSTNSSNDNIESDTEPMIETELSANEQLLYREGIQKLNSEQKEKINKLDTDKLMKAIEVAKQNTNNINFNYLLAIYNNNFRNKKVVKLDDNSKDPTKKPIKQSSKTSNTNVKTKWHDSFNEHFRKYSEDELEQKLLRMQASRRAAAV